MTNYNYLFNDYDLRRVIENHEKAMNEEIAGIEGGRLLNTSVEELVNYFREKYTLVAPSLLEDKITVDQNESQIDVSRDHNRHIWDRSEPYHITGTQIEFFIPYEGDSDLLRCKPSAYQLNPPRGVITDSELVLSYQTTEHEGDTINTEFQRTLKSYTQQ